MLTKFRVIIHRYFTDDVEEEPELVDEDQEESNSMDEDAVEKEDEIDEDLPSTNEYLLLLENELARTYKK